MGAVSATFYNVVFHTGGIQCDVITAWRGFFLYHRDSSGNEGAMEEGYASLEGKTGKGKGRNLSIWCVSD